MTDGRTTEARFIDSESKTVEALRTLMAMKQWIEENPELPLRSVAFVAVWDGDYPGTKSSHVLASGDAHEVTTYLVRAFNEGSAVARQSL